MKSVTRLDVNSSLVRNNISANEFQQISVVYDNQEARGVCHCITDDGTEK